MMDERWAQVHPKITERERKLALIFALKMEPFSPFLRLIKTPRIPYFELHVVNEKLFLKYQ